ncbi:MAG: ribosome biogenesis GTP-binding protein YihA/YsxC [Eubacteriales bacterium]|jgi:GTP-binding protein
MRIAASIMAFNLKNTTLSVSAGQSGQFPDNSLPQIAFSGRSNVGKSSLINTLLGLRGLARVSSTPGKTITINFYNVDNKFYFVDLPGYGYARRPVAEKIRWSRLVDSYFTNNPNIDLLRLVVQLVDLNIGPSADDELMLDFLARTKIPHVIAATKADKLSKTRRVEALEALKKHPALTGALVIPFSSKTGEGKNTLLTEILKAAQPQRK